MEWKASSLEASSEYSEKPGPSNTRIWLKHNMTTTTQTRLRPGLHPLKKMMATVDTFKQLSWRSWRGICLPASTPTIRWSCKRASTMITVTSQEDTPLPPPRILPSIIATIAENRYTGSAQNLLKIKSLRASRIAACNELPVTLLLKYMSRRFCKSKKISYFRLWRLVTGGVLDLGLKIGIYWLIWPSEHGGELH